MIDNVSCRGDVYAPENPQVTTEKDRRTAEIAWKCGKDRLQSCACVCAAKCVSLHTLDVKTSQEREKRAL